MACAKDPAVEANYVIVFIDSQIILESLLTLIDQWRWPKIQRQNADYFIVFIDSYKFRVFLDFRWQTANYFIVFIDSNNFTVFIDFRLFSFVVRQHIHWPV